MFKLRDTKLGFSLVEMMLLLLILSLMTAASVPILSRKHRKAPVKAFHGRYACFWNGNQLWEQQYSGENIIKDGAVAQCKFVAPKKANYFYIQIVGGGGGGGNAGYYKPEDRTALRVTNTLTESARYYVHTGKASSSLSQFDLTEEQFNDFVGTKYTYLAVGSTKGNYCSEHDREEDKSMQCESFNYNSGIYRCADANDTTKYLPEFTTRDACLAGNIIDPATGELQIIRKWIEDVTQGPCENERYGDAGPVVYTNAEQIRFGLHTNYFTDWSDSTTWNSSSNHNNSGEFAGFRNEMGDKISSDIERSLGGKGYRKYFKFNTENIVENMAESQGGEGGEKALCRGAAEDPRQTCACYADSVYLTPDDGDAVSGRETEPTSSEVCLGADANCLVKVTADTPKFGRNEYYQSQNMKYGMGGQAGEYKTFFAREIDPDTIILPGKGGQAGAMSDDTTSYGSDGEASQMGNMIADGGAGGVGNRSTGKLRLPTKDDPEYIANGNKKYAQGDPGAVSAFQFEANLLGIKNPRESEFDYANFGSGGNGTTVTNFCWEGYYKNVFTGAFNPDKGENADIEYKTQYPWAEVTCNAPGSAYPWVGDTTQNNNTSGYYNGAVVVESGNEAQDGYTGAILISW